MSNNILGKMVCRLILSLNFAGKISSKIENQPDEENNFLIRRFINDDLLFR
jgi:hypothetical protein